MPEFILELLFVIKGDDKLDLEALQAVIVDKVKTLASGNKVEYVGQPIRQEAGDVQKDA